MASRTALEVCGLSAALDAAARCRPCPFHDAPPAIPSLDAPIASAATSNRRSPAPPEPDGGGQPPHCPSSVAATASGRMGDETACETGAFIHPAPVGV